MYKYILILIILVSFYSLSLSSTTLSLKYGFQYDNNVFNLSDSDINRFEDGFAYNYVESSDDLVNDIQIGISNTYRFDQLRLSPFIKTTYSTKFNNNDKNSLSFLIGSYNKWNNLRFNISYGYYPQNYLRKYTDTDGTSDYEKFEYKKNLYRFTTSYRFNNLIYPHFYLKYEQYHHNKYFTEYDAPALTSGFGWKFITKYLNIDLFYYYRTYNVESDNDNIQYLIENEKDASYESNIYEIKLKSKKYYSILVDYRIYSGFKLENRYFQSDKPLILDPYHSTRTDVISTINIGSDLWVAKNLNFNLDFKYRFRNVSSDYENVIKSKEYEKFQISTSIEWSFDMFN